MGYVDVNFSGMVMFRVIIYYYVICLYVIDFFNVNVWVFEVLEMFWKI